MPSPAVSIVIPVYNEAENLAAVIDQIHDLGLADYEIIVVDDGSKDDSAAMAEARGARVVRHPYNIGNGAAVKSGLRAARGRIVVCWTLTASILRSRFRPSSSKSRATRWSSPRATPARRACTASGERHLQPVRQLRVGVPVEDLTSGFRAMRRTTARRFLGLLPNTFSYPTTLTIAVLRSGLAVKYVPSRSAARRPQQDPPVRRRPAFLSDHLGRWPTLFSPFRVFLPVAAVFFRRPRLLRLHLLHGAPLHELWPVLLVSAVIIFMMGLVSEQIALMRMERMSPDPPDEARADVS